MGVILPLDFFFFRQKHERRRNRRVQTTRVAPSTAKRALQADNIYRSEQYEKYIISNIHTPRENNDEEAEKLSEIPKKKKTCKTYLQKKRTDLQVVLAGQESEEHKSNHAGESQKKKSKRTRVYPSFDKQISDRNFAQPVNRDHSEPYDQVSTNDKSAFIIHEVYQRHDDHIGHSGAALNYPGSDVSLQIQDETDRASRNKRYQVNNT